MTDSQRNCFLAVAEHRSFSRAADALYVSQPAVSKNISTLEAEIGTPLFDRQGKYIELTKAGEIFFNFLVEYRRELDAMLERIKALGHDSHSGNIRIGCSVTWNAAHFYSRLSRHFSIHFPDIHIEVEGMEPDALLPAIRRKEIDIALMYGLEWERHPDIEIQTLTEIGCGLISSSLPGAALDPSHPTPHRFLCVDFPSDPNNSGFFRLSIKQVCDELKIEPELKICRSLASAMVDVSCGNGLLFVDEWTSAKNNSEFSYMPLDKRLPVCMAHLPAASDSLVGFFAEETRKVFANNY